MNFLELKPLTSALLPAVSELDRLCFGGLWSIDAYQREIDSPNSDLLSLTVTMGHDSLTTDKGQNKEGNQQILLGLGCLWAILEEAHITILAVHPEYRHQGFGQVVLLSLLKSAVNRHLEWATLEVRSSNQPALSLYQKFGFREVGRRRRYYQDTGEDALILWLAGLQRPEFSQTIVNWDLEIHNRLSRIGWLINYQQEINH